MAVDVKKVIAVKGLDREARARVLDVTQENLVLLSLNEWRDNLFFEVRQCWSPNGDGQFLRTKKGVNIPISELDKLIEFALFVRALPDVEAILEGSSPAKDPDGLDGVAKVFEV